MPEFSERSEKALKTCNIDLERLFREVIKYVDCSILEGFRDQETQNKYFEHGKSQVRFPDSKHNRYPSRAVDCVPYPIDWDDSDRMYMFVGFVRGMAQVMKIPIRCGADWDGDFSMKDQKFHDLPHFELIS